MKINEICVNIVDNKVIFDKTFLHILENEFKVRFFNEKGLFIPNISNYIYEFRLAKIFTKSIYKPDIDNYIVDIEFDRIGKVYSPPIDPSKTSLCNTTKLAKEVLDKSDKKGLEKYGMLLDDNLKDNFLVHAKEEAGDLLKYLVHIEQHFKNLCNNYPNDQDLGKLIRKIYG